MGRKGSGNRKDRGKNPAGDNAGASVNSSAGRKGGRRGQGAEKGAKDKKKEKRISAQQSIPYREMAKDGICRVLDKYYSKTIRFYDINYQLAQNEDKNAIFENWCDFLNYFDSTIHFQMSFVNRRSSMEEYESVIKIMPQNDAFDDVRMEYAQMLKNQLAKGNNGLVRTKYITFGIEAENIREAKPRLERIEADILNNFKVLGVPAYPLGGEERLQILYETFNQEEREPFRFSYGQVLRSGMGTKDFVAPSSFVFKNGKDFQMGNTLGAVSYLQILAPELTDRMLAEFLDMDRNLVVNMHIQSIDQLKAIKTVKSKVTDIDRMKLEEQKKAVRSGYDMDIIPSDLTTYGGEAKRLLEDLQTRNERMFLVTVLFLNTAKTKQEEIQTANLILGVLSATIFFVGMMNYFNTILTSLVGRTKEFAVLEGIGLTRIQLWKMLLLEGVYYWLILVGAMVTVGSALLWALGILIKKKLLYFQFIYPWRAMLCMALLLLLVCVVLSVFMYRKSKEQSITERLKRYID